uniref:Uncharacterized protein n=1 Tax=Avena sativa TaxID=4498 RepID=A0ACD5WXJ6_AVESA
MGNYMSNQVSYRHTQRVMVSSAMEAGGCGTKFKVARRYCAGKKKTNAEVLECIEWTSMLRQCMASTSSDCHLKHYLKLMDEGKKPRDKSDESEEERWRWRWWTGMIRMPQPPAPPKKNPFEF